MPDGLYEQDVLVWAEQQSALLRRLASGERLNEGVDWSHVIEEIEDVGLSQLSACESLVRQALVHLLRAWAFPDGPVAHWRGETIGFLADAQSRFAPSMRRRIGLETLYGKALRQVRDGEHVGATVRELPEDCPLTLDDLLDDRFDVAGLTAKFNR